MLDGLDAIPSASLKHAYGSADDVPDVLRAIATGDTDEEPLQELFSSVTHQGTVYSAKALSQKLRGHYSYCGVTGNFRALQQLYDKVQRIWHKWLERRSNHSLRWDKMSAILKAFPLAIPRVVHSAYRCVANP